MANDRKYLSAEEEAKLLKPIDEYIGKIQKKIDALRVDGSDKVQALKTHIALTKEDKNYTKEEQAEIIRQDQEELVKAKAVEAANKEEVSRLIKDAEAYLAAHFNKDYYEKVAESCKAQKEEENAEYAKVRGQLKAEHERTLSKLTDKQEIKDEKYGEAIGAAIVLKNNHEAVTEQEIIEHCCKYIASYKKPRRIVFVRELPHSGVGKISETEITKLFL